MKFARAAGVLALSAFALAGCDDSDDPIEIADFAGDWTATQFTYAETEGQLSVDAVALGGQITLDVDTDGAFTGTMSVPGLTVDPQTGETITLPIGGTISLVSQDEVALDFEWPAGVPQLFQDFTAPFSLNGDVFTFVYETTFDFPDQLEIGSGLEARGDVPVELTARFVR